MPLLGGFLIDTFPGETGPRYFFLFTSGVCVIGYIAAMLVWRRVRVAPDSESAGLVRVRTPVSPSDVSSGYY